MVAYNKRIILFRAKTSGLIFLGYYPNDYNIRKTGFFIASQVEIWLSRFHGTPCCFHPDIPEENRP